MYEVFSKEGSILGISENFLKEIKFQKTKITFDANYGLGQELSWILSERWTKKLGLIERI